MKCLTGIMLSILISLLTVGCTELSDAEKEGKELLDEFKEDIKDFTGNVSDKETSDTGTENEPEKYRNDVENADIISSQETQKISEMDLELYNQIYRSFSNLEEDTELSSTDKEVIGQCVNQVLSEHPEIFYISGYTLSVKMSSDGNETMSISGNYIYSENEIRQLSQMLEAECDRIILGCSKDSDYDKSKYIYEFIIHNTEYNADAKNNQNIVSVLLGHESVCQGYAKAYQYLLSKLGIEARLVSGYTDKGEGHSWNIVKLDGDWYYTDVTWGDSSYAQKSGQSEYAGELPQISYDYLNITSDELAKNHFWDKTLWPECVSVNDNYYIKENLCIMEMNDEDIDRQLSQIFSNAFANGADSVMFKAGNKNCFEKLNSYLLDNQEIFKFLNGKGKVSYYVNESMYTYTFWL